MSFDPLDYRRVYIEAEIHGCKFYCDIVVSREMWDQFSEGEKAAFTRAQILKDVATSYKEDK